MPPRVYRRRLQYQFLSNGYVDKTFLPLVLTSNCLEDFSAETNDRSLSCCLQRRLLTSSHALLGAQRRRLPRRQSVVFDRGRFNSHIGATGRRRVCEQFSPRVSSMP